MTLFKLFTVHNRRTKPVYLANLQAANRPERISVAQLNLWNFFDTVDDPRTYDTVVSKEEYAIRLNKLALTITTTLKSPSILSLNEIENETVLNDILNLPVLKGQGYKGVIRPSNDGRGINVAVLYKGPLEIAGVTSLNVKESFKTDPAKGQLDPSLLYARSPLVVDFRVTGMSQAVDGVRNLSVVVNHFKSKLGGDGPEPRRQRQGEYLGEYVDKRRASEPDREFIVIGDLNATYEDGAYKKLAYRPDGSERLRDATRGIPEADRYTYIYRGKKNHLDHVLTTGGLTTVSAEIPHINTIKGANRYRLDPSTVSGISDHDPILAVFLLS